VAHSALRRFGSLVFVVTFAAGAWAAPASETLLPATTKGFISTHDVEEVRTKFKATQLGELVNDPVMKPFIEDLKTQIGAKLEKAGKRMGLKWADMEGVYGGEVALALVQPDAKDKTSHATVLIVDITGKADKAATLLAKVDANQKANRAVRSALKAGGVEMVVYTQPLAAGAKVPERAFYFIRDEVLVATDHQQVATEIAGRFAGGATDSLATHPGFLAVMKRNADAAADSKQQIRWFGEPFGYVEVSRAMQGGRRKRGNDILRILKDQGFTAIQGLGGYVFFNTGTVEVLHRTYIHAPAVDPSKTGERAKEKYKLAMRMLDFPNAAAPGDLEPQKWALPDVASYLTFNWKLKEAFDYSETLVDAIAGDEGVFDDIWLNLETDPNGPKINIRKELVDLLGERVTIMSDVKMPIDLKSERLMGVVEVKNPQAVGRALQKAFENDPAAKKRNIGGQIIWELTQEEGVAEQEELKIEGAGFVSKDDETEFVSAEDEEAAAEEEGPAVLPNMAMTVYDGHLIIATHVEFIVEFIERQGKHAGLASIPEHKQVAAALTRLGSANDSFRFFTRTEEAYRATFELVKQNKLPQSETVVARLLNGILGAKGEGADRQPAIDGSKLPQFEAISKYLGNGGFYMQTEQNGWLIVGCLLKKEAK
jgi:hypothetical protein